MLDKRLNHLNAQEEDIRRLLTLPGIGPLGASALMIVRLLGITKRGNGYLRGILIHGARSVVYRVQKIPDEQCNGLQRWLKGVIARSGLNRAAVALANKNARIAWALVSQQSSYEPR